MVMIEIITAIATFILVSTTIFVGSLIARFFVREFGHSIKLTTRELGLWAIVTTALVLLVQLFGRLVLSGIRMAQPQFHVEIIGFFVIQVIFCMCAGLLARRIVLGSDRIAIKDAVIFLVFIGISYGLLQMAAAGVLSHIVHSHPDSVMAMAVKEKQAQR